MLWCRGLILMSLCLSLLDKWEVLRGLQGWVGQNLQPGMGGGGGEGRFWRGEERWMGWDGLGGGLEGAGMGRRKEYQGFGRVVVGVLCR